MAGWHIEIANDAQIEEPAVIKRVDLDINCALVAFESGKKEWLDLTLSAFKVVAQSEFGHTDDELKDGDGHQEHTPQQAQQEVATEFNTTSERTRHEGDVSNGNFLASKDQEGVTATQQTAPIPNPTAQTPRTANLAIDLEDRVRMSPVAPPMTDVTGFDWYAEGGHVELCDSSGTFLEGAILCSKTDTHVQLYNETRQFFEITVRRQSFKVVIHGLLSLKRVPMGQTVEVYSAMKGCFHLGTVIKVAEVGKLTPVRDDSGAVEWLDLSTQTFKLVFRSDQASEEVDGTEFDSPSRFPESTMNRHFPHGRHSNHRHHRAAATLEAPILVVGQRIEIYEDVSRLFVKFKVAAVRDETDPIEYQFTSQSPLTNSSTAERICRSSLMNLRCRIPLQPAMWNEYRTILPGYRVDVYDKSTKSVLNGKILEVGSHESDHSMLIRFKDGKKSWIYSHDVKVKLRLSGDPLDARKPVDQQTYSSPATLATNDRNTHENPDPAQGDKRMTLGRPSRPASPHEADHEDAVTKPRPSRHYSGAANMRSLPQDHAAQEPHLKQSASTDDILASRSIEIDAVTMTQTIPSIVQPLDFSSLRKLGSAADISATNSHSVHDSDDGHPTNLSGSKAHGSSPNRTKMVESTPTSSRSIPFSLDDVWREDRDAETGIVEYLHVTSGARQSRFPEWLERRDPSTGKLFAIHTPTSTLYSLPSSTPDTSLQPAASANSSGQANASAPESALTSPSTASVAADSTSSSRVVVPVGAIEAVRVYNMLSSQE